MGMHYPKIDTQPITDSNNRGRNYVDKAFF